MNTLNKKRNDKIDVLDLLIDVLMQHEKRLDQLIGELHLAIQKLNQILDKEEKRTETLIKYYEPL